MSSEIYADNLQVSGTARRKIPMIHRFSNVNINVAAGGGVRVTSTTTSTTQSTGDTGGFVYEASPGRIRNLSGRDLVCLVSYGLLWGSPGVSYTRLAWIQLSDGNERFAMSSMHRADFDGTQSASAIIVIPNNSFITLWVFQSSSGTQQLLSQFGMPYLQLVVI